MNSDTSVIQDSLSTNVSIFMRASVFIIATLIILFMLSPILAVTTFAGIIPIVAFSTKFAYKMKDIAKAVSA